MSALVTLFNRPAQMSRLSTSMQPGGIRSTLELTSQTGEHGKGDCDLVVHASGSPDGLRTAIELAGEEATVLDELVVEIAVTAMLGGPFS